MGNGAYCGGTFDLLHPGHIKLFRWAKQKFGQLTVALNTDEFIYRYKGWYPVMDYGHRCSLLRELRCVDRVVENIGCEDSKPSILAVGPTAIVNGSDWTRERLMTQLDISEKFLTTYGIQLVIFPDSDPIHSSDIKKRMP